MRFRRVVPSPDAQAVAGASPAPGPAPVTTAQAHYTPNVDPELERRRALAGASRTDAFSAGVTETFLGAGEFAARGADALLGLIGQGEALDEASRYMSERTQEAIDLIRALPEERQGWVIAGRIAPWLSLSAARAGGAVLGGLGVGTVAATVEPTVLRQAMVGAAEGAAGGAAAPVGTTGEHGQPVNYWTTKGVQVGTGGIAGATVPPAIQATKAGATGIYRFGAKYLHRVSSPEFRTAYGGWVRAAAGLVDPRSIGKEVDPLLREYGISWGSLSKQSQFEIARMAKAQMDTGYLSPDELARKAVAEAAGFKGRLTPTTGQITHHPTVWALEREVAKEARGEGIAMLSKFQGQAKLFQEHSDEIADALGPYASDITVANMVFDTVANVADESQRLVTEMYEAALDRSTADAAEGFIPVSKLGYTRAWLQNPDIIASEELAPVIRFTKKFIAQYPEGMDPDTVELFRKALQRFRAPDGNSAQERYYATQLVHRIEDDIIEDYGDDMFKAARDAARARFKSQEAKVIQRILGKESNVLREDKFIQTHIVNGEKRQLKALIKTLVDPDAPMSDKARAEAIAQGLQTKAHLKRRVWEWMVNGTGERDTALKIDTQNGAVEFIGYRFKKRLEQLARGEQLEVLFEPDEIAAFNRFASLGEMFTINPPHTTGMMNVSGTSAQQFNRALRTRGFDPGAALREDRLRNELRSILAGQYKFLPREDAITRFMQTGAERVRVGPAGAVGGQAFESGVRPVLKRFTGQGRPVYSEEEE